VNIKEAINIDRDPFDNDINEAILDDFWFTYEHMFHEKDFETYK